MGRISAVDTPRDGRPISFRRKLGCRRDSLLRPLLTDSCWTGGWVPESVQSHAPILVIWPHSLRAAMLCYDNPSIDKRGLSSAGLRTLRLLPWLFCHRATIHVPEYLDDVPRAIQPKLLALPAEAYCVPTPI